MILPKMKHRQLRTSIGDWAMTSSEFGPDELHRSSPGKAPCANTSDVLGRTAFGSRNSIYLSNPKNGHQTNRTVQ